MTKFARILFAFLFNSLMLAIPTLPNLASAAPVDWFPSSIQLPNGWQPEGIAHGRGTTVYSGSLATGAIYRADLRTGQGSVLVQPEAGRMAVGLNFDERTQLIYVAGGATGKIYVYDSNSGASVAAITATTNATTFVNDVAIARDAVYFTDSSRPVMYRLPLAAGGRLPANPVALEIPLSGDFTFVPDEFNSNGIVAVPGTHQLIIVNSVLGNLYLVDRASGHSRLIDLGSDTVLNGDGLMLKGHELYVVQNFANQIAVVGLDGCYESGSIRHIITDERFDFPTTLVALGRSLYVVNARIPTPPSPDMQYAILRVAKHD